MILEKYPEILIATSKASDGNMSLLRGDPGKALKNRGSFLASLGLNLDQITTINLQHSNKIMVVRRKDLGKGALSVKDAPGADGLITNERGVYLFIMVADCPVIALYDPYHQAIGLIHAGRVGLEKKVLQAAVKLMAEKYKSSPLNLLAQMNPSIGPCCYKPVDPKKSS